MSEIIEGYRLSPQQRRLWQLQRGGRAGRSQCALQLDGPVRPEALREALMRVVRRHEILRTRFLSAPGVNFPLQVIEEDAGLDWRTTGWGHISADEEEARLRELFAEEERAQQASANEPPLRATLVGLSDGRSLLHLSLPALSADAQTFANLTREVA